MSAYVVENVTISKIVRFLASTARPRICGIPDGFSLAELDTIQGRTAIGQRMLDLNVRSVSERYRTQESAAPYVEVACVAHKPVDALKALRCFLYQSCEGSCDKDPLFVALSEFSRDLALGIVSNSPEYEAADWG